MLLPSSPAYLLHAVLTNNLLGTQLSCTKLEIVTLLLNNGAHLDAIDHRGRSCFTICTDQDIKNYFRNHLPLSLSCLASNAIVAHKIDYDKMPLPKHIKELVSLHDSSRIQPPFCTTAATTWNYRTLHKLMYHDSGHCTSASKCRVYSVVELIEMLLWNVFYFRWILTKLHFRWTLSVTEYFHGVDF